MRISRYRLHLMFTEDQAACLCIGLMQHWTVCPHDRCISHTWSDRTVQDTIAWECLMLLWLRNEVLQPYQNMCMTK